MSTGNTSEGAPPRARVKLVEREELSPEAQKLYDHVSEVRGGTGRQGNVFKALANNPYTLEKVAAVGEYIRATRKDPALNELAICVTAAEANCAYELGAHRNAALRAGVEERLLDMLGTLELEKEPYPVGPIARFARLVARGDEVDDATFDLLKSKLGDEGIIDLLATVGYYLMLARFINTVRLPLDRPLG